MICVGFQVALFWIDDKKKGFFWSSANTDDDEGGVACVAVFFSSCRVFLSDSRKK